MAGKFLMILSVDVLGDPAVLVASNKKAKDLLGWKLDNSSLEYILKTALAWEQNKRY